MGLEYLDEIADPEFREVLQENLVRASSEGRDDCLSNVPSSTALGGFLTSTTMSITAYVTTHSVETYQWSVFYLHHAPIDQ